MKTRALSSIATALVSGLLVAGSTLPAEAAGASSTIVRIPTAVSAAADGSFVSVPVRYKCTNNSRYTHYVTGLLSQAGPGGWDLQYVAGYRSDTGGTVLAKCTGKAVTHWLRLKEGSNSNPDATLAKGSASLEFNLERRKAQGNGPGWYSVVSTKSAEATVTVR